MLSNDQVLTSMGMKNNNESFKKNSLSTLHAYLVKVDEFHPSRNFLLTENRFAAVSDDTYVYRHEFRNTSLTILSLRGVHGPSTSNTKRFGALLSTVGQYFTSESVVSNNL